MDEQERPESLPDESVEDSASDLSPEEVPASAPVEGRPEDSTSAQLEETQKLVETLRDQLLRKAAEFENYKRRTELEFASLIRNANENLLLALIPVVDDFGRSLRSGKDLQNPDAFYAGVEMVNAKFLKILEKHGLVPFVSVGKPFDVDYHDALLQVPNADVPPHTVVQEIEPGFMLHDKVLRHAKVIVSSAPIDPEVPNGKA